MSIEAVLQPRFYYAECDVSFDAEALFASLVFGDDFFNIRIICTYRFRLRLAPFGGLHWPFSANFHLIFALIYIINVIYILISIFDLLINTILN